RVRMTPMHVPPKSHAPFFMYGGNGKKREATKKVVRKLIVSHKRSRRIDPRLPARDILNLVPQTWARTSSPVRRGSRLLAQNPIIMTQKRSGVARAWTGSSSTDHRFERSRNSAR